MNATDPARRAQAPRVAPIARPDASTYLPGPENARSACVGPLCRSRLSAYPQPTNRVPS